MVKKSSWSPSLRSIQHPKVGYFGCFLFYLRVILLNMGHNGKLSQSVSFIFQINSSKIVVKPRKVTVRMCSRQEFKFRYTCTGTLSERKWDNTPLLDVLDFSLQTHFNHNRHNSKTKTAKGSKKGPAKAQRACATTYTDT